MFRPPSGSAWGYLLLKPLRTVRDLPCQLLPMRTVSPERVNSARIRASVDVFDTWPFREARGTDLAEIGVGNRAGADHGAGHQTTRACGVADEFMNPAPAASVAY